MLSLQSKTMLKVGGGLWQLRKQHLKNQKGFLR